MRGIEFEDIDLNGPGELEKELTRDIRDYREFYLDHMIHQFFRHGRVNGKFYVDFDKIPADDLWGYAGGELGKRIGEALREKNDIYGSGYCVVPFGNTISVAALKLSENPNVKLDMKIDSERITQQEVKEFFKNFSSESGIDVFLISYPLQLIIPKVGKNTVYDVGSTDEEHHILEAGFKSLANAFHYLKSRRSNSLVFKPTMRRQRISYKERNTHETQISLSLNLDGEGKNELDFTCRLPSDIVDSFRQAHSYMIQASSFDVGGKCIGDDEHHLIEDFGITEGESITKGLEKRGTIKGIMRYGYDVQVCNNCGRFAIAATDIIRRPCYASNLSSGPRREQQLFSHYFEQLFENAGIDGYVATGRLDSLKEIFDEEIGVTLQSIFGKDSLYQSAPDLIKGTYDIKTNCDDKYHQNELLFAAVGRALKLATRVDRSRARYLPTTKGLM